MAPRDHPGGPWEQQDGLEAVDTRIFVDFGVIWGIVYAGFLISKYFKICCFRSCFHVILLSISVSKYRRLGLSNQGFRIEGLQKSIVDGFLLTLSVDVSRLLNALEAVFSVF